MRTAVKLLTGCLKHHARLRRPVGPSTLLRRAENRAEDDLAEVKAQPGGDVEELVAMMDFVEAPEQGHFVAAAVQEIGDEIEDHDIDEQAGPAGSPRATPVEESVLRRLADGDDGDG